MSSTKPSPDSRFDTTDLVGAGAGGAASGVPSRISRGAERSAPTVVRIPDRKSGPVRIPPPTPAAATPIAAAPTDEAPAAAMLAEGTSVAAALADDAPTAATLAEGTAVSQAPVEVAPVEVAPVEVAPVEVAPVEVAPVEAPPVAATLPAASPADAAPLAVKPISVPTFATPMKPRPTPVSTPAVAAPVKLPPAATPVSLPALPLPPQSLIARASSTIGRKSDVRVRKPSTPLEAALERAVEEAFIDANTPSLEAVRSAELARLDGATREKHITAEGTPLGTPAVEGTSAEPAAVAAVAVDAAASPTTDVARLVRDVGPTMKTQAIARERKSRKVLIASIAMAATAVAVTVGVVVWARTSVSQAERIAEVSQSPMTPAVPTGVAAEPGGARLTTAEPAPAPSEPVPAPAPAPRPAPTPKPAPPPVVRHAATHEKTSLTVWSEPAGADVVYNGVVIGKTPLVTKVDRGETATIWFHKKNYTSDWRKIVTKEAAKTVSIQLKGVILRPPI